MVLGFIDDVIKALPENSILREKVQNLATENTLLKDEIAALKDDVRQLETENKRLKEKIESFTHKPDLHETEREIVNLLARHGRSLGDASIERALNLPRTRVQYYLDKLSKDHKYITRSGTVCGLTQRGREYAVKNNLI